MHAKGICVIQRRSLKAKVLFSKALQSFQWYPYFRRAALAIISPKSTKQGEHTDDLD